MVPIWVDKSDNVVMLRTFSKLYAMAGLRLGWAYAPSHVINALQVVKQPFGANRVSGGGCCGGFG